MNPRAGLFVNLAGVFGLLLALILSACKKPGNSGGTGGAANSVKGTNFVVLIAQSKELANEGRAQGKNTWTTVDRLPRAIQALSPQFVQLQVTDSPKATSTSK